MATYKKQLKDKDGNVIVPAVPSGSLIDIIYPVGSIYMSATLSTAADVGSALGGTWVAWGVGRVPVGVDSSDTDFDTAEETGGSKTKTLSATIGACNDNAGALGYIVEDTVTYQLSHSAGYVVTGGMSAYSHWNHSTPVVESNSSSRQTSIVQPYITCYMYKRVS